MMSISNYYLAEKTNLLLFFFLREEQKHRRSLAEIIMNF